jgi:hypothetical protein
MPVVRRSDLGFAEGAKPVINESNIKCFFQISAITPEKVRFFTCASIKQLEEPELQVSNEDETNNWLHLLFGDRFHELVFLGAIFIKQDSQIPDVVLCLDHKAFEKWLPSTPQPSEEGGVTVVGNIPDDNHWALISFDQYLEDIKTLDQDSLICPFDAKTYKAALQRFLEHMRQRIIADSRTFKRMFLGVVEDEVPEQTADVEAVDVNNTANLSGDTNALSGTDCVDSDVVAASSSSTEADVVASSSSTETAVPDVSNNISDAGSNKRKHKNESDIIPLSYNGGRNAFKGKTDYKHLLYPPMPKAIVSTSDPKKPKPVVNKVPVGEVNVAEPKPNLNDPAIKKLVNSAATAASAAASKAVQAKLEAAQKQVADMETKMQKQAADMEKKMKKQLADLEEKHAESEDKLKKKIAKAGKPEERNDEAIRVAEPECKETKREQLKIFSKVADKFLIHGVKTLTELKKAGISFTDSSETGPSLPISNMIGSPLACYQSLHAGQIQQQNFAPCYYQTHASQQSPSLQMIPHTPMQSQHFQQLQQIQLHQQVPVPQNSFQHCQLPEMQTMSQQQIQPQLLQTQFIQPQMMQPQMQSQMMQPQMIQPQKQFQQQIQPPQMMQSQMVQPQMMQPQMPVMQPQMMQPQMMQPVTQQQQPQMQPQLQQQMHPPLQQQVAIASGSGPILQQLSQSMSGSQTAIDATHVSGSSSYFS